jgi:protein involved in polysaccharide export with SLBB domain
MVGIYATHPQMIPRVHSALKEFTRNLPEDVRPEGPYVDFPATTAPDAPEYLLSEGDTLVVTIPGLDPQNTTATVQPDGRLPIPYAKPVSVRRLHVADVAARVDEALARSEDPRRPKGVGRAQVRLVEGRCPRFAVIGNVYRPGEFRWCQLPSAETVLARSGGRTSLADLFTTPYAYRLNGDVYERIAITPEDAVHPLDVLVFP